ncbi:MAG: lipoyl(octanoyl) transferase LipB [Solirubrobacterales bacterium]
MQPLTASKAASKAASKVEIACSRLGPVPYRDALGLQRRLARARQEGSIADTLLLLEHPPVYTRGRRATADELPMGEQWYAAQGIEIVETDRGGRVTYHGPGQLVGYPIMSLRPYRDDVHDYVRRMERTIVDTLARYGIETATIDGLTGVWTPQRRKIASIGVHVSRGVTTHGFAINVNNDLRPFGWIVPCGIEHCEVSSVCRELGLPQDMDRLMDVVCEQFGSIYERRPVAFRVPEAA